MLEKLDLSKKVSKEEYNRQMEVLGERLGKAQRLARDAKRPIIIVFEGWRGARRSALINEMMQQMDARGFNVYSSVRLRGVMRSSRFSVPSGSACRHWDILPFITAAGII